ncbi:MAG: hypothetical protein D4R68_00045 [Ignavibacteriales bacterium]|nr:MAG: hypothetical protein D4R68_00045 [Ignavibacteriales bacterium]
MKNKIALTLRIVIGAVFLFSAYTKFISPGLTEIILVDHGIVSTRETAAIIVRLLIGFEFALGILLILPYSLKTIVIPAAILFLIIFTGYLAYTGFILKDTQNCGCFGEMIKMSPLESIMKNIVLIAVLILLFKFTNEKKKHFVTPTVVVLCIASVFVFLPVNSQKEFKFANYTNFESEGRVDLSRDEKLLVILNLECDHCQILAKELSEIKNQTNKLPKLYALLFKEGNVTVDSFEKMTKFNFPYHMIDMNEFLNLIGQTPPRIYWLKNGKVKEIWDEDFQKKILQNFPDR